ncbi:hypothetical protein E8D34_10490 [Nocardioides sp. GY 10113]|uniref:M15 family metallopeptidase n=1 Tax=Nocardioides sp. GY 10113 TaxID=2569761 RepID=UPI0010A8E741|nr:M15 family metallopeptidase [Nocardioides sp. GY 10113]TIC87532.1 hypothetical protein E8D34_10490 [Nocardioides sp. GY 10113]
MRSYGVVAGLLTLLVAAGLLVPAAAETYAGGPTELTAAAPAAVAGTAAPVTLTLTGDGLPVPGADLTVERRTSGSWAPLAVVTTDADGAAVLEVTLATRPADNRVRARYDGDAEHDAASVTLYLALRRAVSRLRLTGPATVVDETSATLTARWRAARLPVAGPVRLQQRRGGGWHTVRSRRTGADGEVGFRVAPRTDSRWRVVADALPWATGARSAVHALENLPPGTPVSLPRAAPEPRVALPRQARAVGAGARPTITPIPRGVWRQMRGNSWHRGCPVGRAGLRLLRINYWGYDGYRYRGELVAAAEAIAQMADALAAMYRRQLPIRSMYRVDRFGWSQRLRGADDYASMAAGNTSAFNCRDVVGRPGVRSPHADGRSLDVNPWENPYRSQQGVHPNRWWLTRSDPRVAWRSRGHAVVRVMARNGLRWTYGLGDLHHFDAAVAGRRLVPRGCADAVCH